MSMPNPRSVSITFLTIAALLVPVTGASASASASAGQPNPDSLAVAEECSAGKHVLPNVEDGKLVEGVVYSDVYAIGTDCSTTVISHTETPEKSATVGSVNAALAVTPLATIYTTNVIHTSQTLQDIVNLDISRFRYAHETTLQTGTGVSYVKFSSWRAAESWPGGLAWNHASAPLFGSYTSSYTTAAATASAHGAFHSDFLWCNLQAGQDFTLYTQILRSPSAWSTAFSQSRTCAGTHMATDKKMNTTYNQW